jgi:transcriptional regulator with PAS, ATPase and Fis domain
MPLPLQSKLLRVLQEGTLRPLGSHVERKVDVRIVCATYRDLAEEVAQKRFRQDLYYRLMVVPLRLPPLRGRREDIPLLAEHFVRRYAREYNRDVAGLSQDVIDALAAYPWPGNIRELENEIQRLVIHAEPGAWIQASELSAHVRHARDTLARIRPEPGALKETLEQVELSMLLKALSDHDRNKTRAAQGLGITREGLQKKLIKFGL